MKNLILLTLLSLLISCSESENPIAPNQEPLHFFKVNETLYPISNAYVLEAKYSNGDFAGYNVVLLNGEISTNNDMDGIESFSNQITNAASFFIKFNTPVSGVPTGTFIYNPSQVSGSLINYGIVNNIIIANGNISSSNTISNQADLIGNNGRIIISRTGSVYNINFNLVTTLGLIQGQFTGEVTKNF